MNPEKLRMFKHNYLALSLIAVVFIQSCHNAVAEPEARGSKAPPNIVMIMTDDQRWDQFGLVQREQGDSGRFPFIETPNLDALAAEGMRFRNAFVTTSLCSPSRSAMLTGQYNHTNGIFDNFTHFTARPTWATALQSEGYTTAMFGKWHHGNQRDRPGFDVISTFVDQGKYFNNNFIVNGEVVETEGYIDSVTVDFAIDFLETQGKKPFAMLVGFKAVHQPFMPMLEHAERYHGDEIRPSPNLDSKAPWLHTHKKNDSINLAFYDILRTVDGVDQNVGRLLDALARLDLADNSLVIFTSDNGYYFREHGLGDKRSAYEESIRVPLLMRLPGVIEAGTVSDELVINIDLAPTILDMVGMAVPTEMQGLSMRPLLEEEATPWRKGFLYEYWQLEEKGLARTIPTTLAVRTATHKLITYPGHDDWIELYDLTNDPYEVTNLVGDPESKKLKTEMQALLQQLKSESNFPEGNEFLRGSRADR
jgi:arylsulfatase A-like enzyme